MLIRHSFLASALLTSAAITAGPAHTQETEATDAPASKVLVIHDWSNSMWGAFADGSRKYEAGITALTNALDAGFGGVEDPLVLIRTGHLALQASRAFFRFQLERP